MADFLEDEVDEKFYLSDGVVRSFNNHKEMRKKGNGFGWQPSDGNGIAFTLKASSGCRADDNFIKKPYCQGVMISNQGETIGKTTDVCSTLIARDYKGFGKPSYDWSD